MPSPIVTVLVVDDHEPFRRFVDSTLEIRPEIQIVGYSSDGADAVYRAEKLEPQLIILDIGLPTLNGIEAARKIRKVVPESKIIFLTHEVSAEAIHEAFKLGAMGYVVKSRAGSDLLHAIEAVLSGKQFLSSHL